MIRAILVLLFPTFAFAGNPVEPTPLDGHWSFVDHNCSSGAPVRDGFVFDRDSWQLSFNAGHFDSNRQILNCNYWSRGEFNISGKVLELTHIVGASNCTNEVPYPRASVVFAIENGNLSLFSNNSGYGSPCPAGDALESVFKRDRNLD